jgi:hypothetical protein
MADDTIHLRLYGGGIDPTKLRSRQMADLITDYENALNAMVVREYAGFEKNPLPVSLVSIQEGSVNLEFAPALPELTIPLAAQLHDALEREDWWALPRQALESLRNIRKQIAGLDCVLSFSTTIKGISQTVTLVPTTVIPQPQTLMGESELYGQVIRVGGKDPVVAMLIDDGRVIFCPATAEIARALGSRLYEHVQVSGRGIWEIDTLDLVAFEIRELLPYEETTISQAFAELRQSVGSLFDDIEDPSEWVRQLRNEEDDS